MSASPDDCERSLQNTPKLLRIDLAFGGTRDFGHGEAGHLTHVSSNGNVILFTYDAAGRLEQADRLGTVTPFAYDGRSYLTAAGSEAAATGASHPVYSSGGLLHTLTQGITASDPGEAHHVFHFAGRPVAQLSVDGATETWRYLTTDHLGTPWVATDAAGAELWHGPFEPFGRDRWAGTTLAAAAEDVFLRFPGQWDDEVWLEATRGAEVYYNLHRWYQPDRGNYSSADPLGIAADVNTYRYAEANPLLQSDPLGLLKIPVTYHPIDYYRPNVCGPGRLGCLQIPWGGDCECRSVKPCWWFARAGVTVGPISVYYSKNCDDPEEIIEHELRHAEVFEDTSDRAQESAVQLGRRRFTTKAACEAACDEWLRVTERQFDHTRPHLLHMIIDLFGRGCKKWF